MSALTEAEVREMLERAELATAGPWKLWNGWGPHTDNLHRCERIGPRDVGTPGVQTFDGYRKGDLVAPKADFEFIAHARTDLPRLARDWLEMRRLGNSMWDSYHALDGARVDPDEANVLSTALAAWADLVRE